MTTPLVIYGAGGHAREAAQLVADINRAQPGRWQLLGFLVDDGAPAIGGKPLPGPLLGNATWLLQPAHRHVAVMVAVGNSAGRSHVVARLQQQRASLPSAEQQQPYATLIHPTAWFGDQVQLGEGSMVFAGSLINTDVSIGAHASINLGCTISHDSVLGDFVSLGPGVHLAGRVDIGRCADIGTGAVCRPGVRVGADVVIGAGAVMVSDPPPGVVAVGVPGRWPRGS